MAYNSRSRWVQTGSKHGTYDFNLCGWRFRIVCFLKAFIALFEDYLEKMFRGFFPPRIPFESLSELERDQVDFRLVVIPNQHQTKPHLEHKHFLPPPHLCRCFYFISVQPNYSTSWSDNTMWALLKHQQKSGFETHFQNISFAACFAICVDCLLDLYWFFDCSVRARAHSLICTKEQAGQPQIFLWTIDKHSREC